MSASALSTPQPEVHAGRSSLPALEPVRPLAVTAALDAADPGLAEPALSVGPRVRFLMLFIIALLGYGSYFAYDSIGALGPLLVAELHIDRAQIGLLYSVYSWPNVVMVLFGGVLIDRLGVRRAAVLLSGLVAFGAAVVAAAPTLLSGRAAFIGMLVGRTLFGLGSESLLICQNAMIARWFRGRELALAFGLSLTALRLGTMLVFSTEAAIAEHFGGVRAGLWAAALCCVISLVAGVAFSILDRRAEGHGLVPPCRTSTGGAESAGERFAFGDLLRFPQRFYLLVALCTFFYAAFFPFTSFAPDFLSERFHLDATAAGRLTSLQTLSTMLLSPLLGLYLDRRGHHGRLLLLGSLIMIPCYLALALSSSSPVPAVLGLGLAFSLVPTVVWPTVPLLVPPARVGSAYGLMSMLQAVGMALVPWGSGALRDSTGNYAASLLLLAGLGGVCTLIGLLALRSFSGLRSVSAER